MRHSVKTIYGILFAAFVCTLYACSDNSYYYGDYMELDTNKLVFSYEGGSQQIQINTESAWSVSDSGDGISIYPTQGNGSETITVSVPYNYNQQSIYRELTIYNNGYLWGWVSIYQEANPYQAYKNSGLYLAVTGFNNQLTKFEQGDFNTIDDYNSFSYFINSLTTDDGTILYYAVEDAINQMENTRFPEDLNSVSLITFTDGLDQGSSAMNANYDSATAYLTAISNRLKSTKVGGLPITAYTIGLKGNDVSDDALFRQNIIGLASSDANTMEVTNINEINAQFQELATSLSKETSQNLTLTIPQPYNNTKIRFTFDIEKNGDAADSQYYIEGTYTSGALTNVVYKGLTCSSGTRIEESKKENSINVSFVFEDMQYDNDFEPVISNIKQWDLISSTSKWQINSEFNPDKSVDIERHSAVIVLLLDCSSSLGSDFATVKTAANNFIRTLHNAYNSK